MTNSQLFKTAHIIARKVVSKVGDYRVAFSWALKELNKGEMRSVWVNKVIAKDKATGLVTLSLMGASDLYKKPFEYTINGNETKPHRTAQGICIKVSDVLVSVFDLCVGVKF